MFLWCLIYWMAIFVQDNICSDRNQTMMPICVNVYMHVGVCINMYMIVDMCMSIYWPCLLLLFFYLFFFHFYFIMWDYVHTRGMRQRCTLRFLNTLALPKSYAWIVPLQLVTLIYRHLYMQLHLSIYINRFTYTYTIKHTYEHIHTHIHTHLNLSKHTYTHDPAALDQVEE